MNIWEDYWERNECECCEPHKLPINKTAKCHIGWDGVFDINPAIGKVINKNNHMEFYICATHAKIVNLKNWVLEIF